MKRFLIFLFLGSCVSAFAQPAAISAGEKKEQTVVTEPITVYGGIWRIGWGTRLEFPDKSFVDGNRQAHDENIWASKNLWPLFATYGITDRLMLKMVIPYVQEDYYYAPVYLFPSGSDQQYSYPQRWRTQARGFGDVDFSLGYQLLQESKSRPALATFLTLTLPTGRKDVVDDDDENDQTFALPTGQGEFGLETAVMLRKISYPHAYSLTVFYIYRTEASKILAVGEEATAFQNGRRLGASATFHSHLNSWIVFLNQLDVVQVAANKKNGESAGDKAWMLQHFLGLSFQLKQLRINQGISLPLMGNNVAADPAYHMNLQYSF